MKNLNLQELTIQEQVNIEGGRVPFSMFLISPGMAYIISRFEDGCECDVVK